VAGEAYLPPRHRLISVSQHALDDFDRHVGLKGTAHVLPNFVNPRFLAGSRVRSRSSPLRLVAVGNLKPVKNYSLLVKALRGMEDEVELDIYGEGPDRAALERQIASAGAKVRLIGARTDLWNVLPDYDAFVMPSLYEGCPNAAIEAMAVGLPLLLSDIPVMREVSRGNALFFDPHDPAALAGVIQMIAAGEVDAASMGVRGREIVAANHQKEVYLQRLKAIYSEAVGIAADADWPQTAEPPLIA
jgi:glycosyltransferase involved in cell wall biosynthesis